MPGLAGHISLRERTLERSREILDAFARVQALPGVSYVERRYASGRCAISNTLTGILKDTLDQPATDAERGIHLFIEGEVYNVDELIRLVDMPPGVTPCRILLELFLQRGPDMAPLLDGNFNMVLCEEREGRVTILNDRMSIKPLYFLDEAGSFLFASEKKCILAVREAETRIDPVGLLQIFNHRHNVSGRTFIDGMKRLPAASILTFRDGRIHLRRYERLAYSPLQPTPPAGALAAEWCECLKADVARRVRGKQRILIFLSGGLDSRAVACAIPREFRPVVARTRGASDSLEAICAAAVAQRLGILHFIDDPEEVPYSAVLPSAVWRTECEVSFLNCMSLADHARMKAHGDVIFAGQSGEVPAGGHIYPYMFLPGTRDAFRERVFRTYSLYRMPMLSRVFSAEFLRRTYPAVREEFKRSLEFLEDESHVDAYQTWNLRERQPRMTLAPGAADSHLFEKVYALLGRDYVNFALKLPLRLRYGATLYHAMIWRLGPDVRDVPYANTGFRIRQTVGGNLVLKAVDLASKGAKFLGHKLRMAAPKRRVAALANLGSATRADLALRRRIEEFVGSGFCDPAVFNRQGIVDLVEEHYSCRADRAHLLCLLATFSVGLPWFVYGSLRSCPSEAEPSR